MSSHASLGKRDATRYSQNTPYIYAELSHVRAVGTTSFSVTGEINLHDLSMEKKMYIGFS